MIARDYPVVYRIMHWAIALCMLFLLLTIFLRTTWMSRESMADIIQGYAAEKGIAMDNDMAGGLARRIREPMWNWHIYTGYVLVGLFAIRFALPLFGTMRFANPLGKQLSAKVKFQYALYLVFYACVAVSLTTGLFIKFGPESLEEAMEEVHVLSIYYLLTFIGLHLGGVFLAEFTDQQGIVSRIVSGKRNGE